MFIVPDNGTLKLRNDNDGQSKEKTIMKSMDLELEQFRYVLRFPFM
jgi:hypothetical protein